MLRAARLMHVDNEDRMSRRPSLAGIWALFLEGCSRLGFLAANAPAVFGSYKRYANIAFGPEPQQRLDVYVPGTAAGPRPVVVFWHGGRWRYGAKTDYRFVAAAVAESGHVVRVAHYRHPPPHQNPGFTNEPPPPALPPPPHP